MILYKYYVKKKTNYIFYTGTYLERDKHFWFSNFM